MRIYRFVDKDDFLECANAGVKTASERKDALRRQYPFFKKR